MPEQPAAAGSKLLQVIVELAHHIQALHGAAAAEHQQMSPDFCVTARYQLSGKPATAELELMPCYDLARILRQPEKLTRSGPERVHLVELPSSFGDLRRLGILNLNGCIGIAVLPESFCSLSSLQNLDLSYCDSLGHLPTTFGNLSCLWELSLEQCRLSSLPDTFGNLIKLERLNLMYSDLVTFPDDFGRLCSLQHLNLSACWSLRNLPSSSGLLSSLRHVYLCDCEKLEALPATFSSLTQLERLCLMNTGLDRSVSRALAALLAAMLATLCSAMALAASTWTMTLIGNKDIDHGCCSAKCSHIPRSDQTGHPTPCPSF